MLVFDAWIGNNDRHFYNWGVVEHISGQHPPYFSPIYDTARGLYWNASEKKVNAMASNTRGMGQSFAAYVNKSSPRISCEGYKPGNHFDLLVQIMREVEYVGNIADLIDVDRIANSAEFFSQSFSKLFSNQRLSLMKMILEKRTERFLQII